MIETLAKQENGGKVSLPALQFRSPVRRAYTRRRQKSSTELQGVQEETPAISPAAFYGAKSGTGRSSRRPERRRERKVKTNTVSRPAQPVESSEPVRKFILPSLRYMFFMFCFSQGIIVSSTLISSFEVMIFLLSGPTREDLHEEI